MSSRTLAAQLRWIKDHPQVPAQSHTRACQHAAIRVNIHGRGGDDRSATSGNATLSLSLSHSRVRCLRAQVLEKYTSEIYIRKATLEVLDGVVGASRVAMAEGAEADFETISLQKVCIFFTRKGIEGERWRPPIINAGPWKRARWPPRSLMETLHDQHLRCRRCCQSSAPRARASLLYFEE